MNFRYLLKVVSILIFSVPISGQTTFSKVYNTVNGNEYGSNLKIIKDKYFVINRAVIDPLEQISPYVDLLSVVNQKGDLTSYYNFWEETWIAPTKPFCQSNDTFYIFGHDWLEDSSLWKVFKFNTSGDSLQLLTLKLEAYLHSTAIINSGEYFFLGGNSSTPEVGDKLVIFKLDKHGRLVKEDNLLDFADPVNVNRMYDMIETSDGHLVICNYFRDVVLNTFNVGICKINKNLEIIWTKYVHDVSDHSNIFPYITPTRDNGFALKVGLDFRDSINWSNPQYKNYGDWPTVIYKIDSDGNIVWTDTMFTFRGPNFEPAPYNETYNLTTAANGDIIGVGTYNHPIKQPHRFGWMFRYSPDGKINSRSLRIKF
jgi:hypothetical protein